MFISVLFYCAYFLTASGWSELSIAVRVSPRPAMFGGSCGWLMVVVLLWSDQVLQTVRAAHSRCSRGHLQLVLARACSMLLLPTAG